MTHETTHTLVVERRIRASQARVWHAWTDPDTLRVWSCPIGMHIPEGRGDFRLHGDWEVTMVRDDTGERHVAFGTYLEIDPPRRVVQSHQWRMPDGSSSPPTTVAVDIIDEGETTLVRITQGPFAHVGSRDGHGEGWSSALDNLTTLLETTTFQASVRTLGTPGAIG